MKLTKSSVEKLGATGKRYVHFDDDLKGLAVRVGASGARHFYFVYRAGKGRTAPLCWLRLGSFPTISVEKARKMASEKAALVALGGDPAQDVRDNKVAPTVKTIIETFYSEHVEAKLKKSSRKQYRGLIDNYIVPAIGKLKVADVEHRHIAQLHHSMRETPYFANRAYAVTSKFFSWAEKNGYRARGSNPATGVEKYKEHKRNTYMDVEELSRLGEALFYLEHAWHEREVMRKCKERIPANMAAISPNVVNVFRLLCLTGARLGEVLSLKWEYLDLNMGLARLPDSKTGAKVLHLPKPAIEVLNDIPKYTEWVFPGRGVDHLTDVHHAWNTICKEAGLTGWRIHDLRHAFASTAVNSGHSLPQIGALLGHAQSATTARYAHVAENPVHAVAEDAGEKIARAMKLQKKENTIPATSKATEVQPK